MPSFFFLEKSQGKRLEMGVGETMFLEPSLQRNVYNISGQEISLYLRNAKEITIGRKNEGTANVKHRAYCVQAKDKYEALKRVVDYYPDIYAIIFCRTRKETQEYSRRESNPYARRRRFLAP